MVTLGIWAGTVAEEERNDPVTTTVFLTHQMLPFVVQRRPSPSAQACTAHLTASSPPSTSLSLIESLEGSRTFSAVHTCLPLHTLFLPPECLFFLPLKQPLFIPYDLVLGSLFSKHFLECPSHAGSHLSNTCHVLGSEPATRSCSWVPPWPPLSLPGEPAEQRRAQRQSWNHQA